MDDRLFLRSVKLREGWERGAGYAANLPAVLGIHQLESLDFQKPVTFLVGENGAGKSTLLEAVAVAWGFNPEGGSRHFNFSTTDNENCSPLYRYLAMVRGPRRPRDGFFLRAESFYNVASAADRMLEDDVNALLPYGGRSLHEQSHGESFLTLLQNRFRGNGLYCLDEPEAALSPQNQMAALACFHKLAQSGAQLLIATHSPILMACPDSQVLVLDGRGITPTPFEETEHYLLTRQFLNNPKQMLRYLFEEH